MGEESRATQLQDDDEKLGKVSVRVRMSSERRAYL